MAIHWCTPEQWLDVEMTWTKAVLFWLNTILLCYNFYMAWNVDPGFIKSNREQKLQVSEPCPCISKGSLLSSSNDTL